MEAENLLRKQRESAAKAQINSIITELRDQKESGILYPLQPKQEEFSNLFVRYRLYGGAKGGGKSYAIRAEAVRQCLSGENIKGLILRKTFPEVRKNTLAPMKIELKQKNVSFNYNGNEKIMQFENGSNIEFSYCRNETDVLRYQGLEYDFIAIEELTHWKEESFKTLKGCLRTSVEGITPNFFASTNPGGPGHVWVRRIWIDRNFTENEDPNDYAFVSANVYDNAVLLKSQPDYEKELKDLSEHKREAFLYGNWDVFEGQYFTEFSRDQHVIDNILPIGNEYVEYLICVDYGFSAPASVHFLTKDTQGHVFCYREIYVTGKTYTELAGLIAKSMTEIEKKLIKKIIIDPAAINKKSETNKSTLKKDFEKVLRGIIIKPGNNARLDGWMNIRQHLVSNKISITKSCKNLIRTLPELIYDDTNVEDCDTDQEDHAPDGLRYGLMEISFHVDGFNVLNKINNSFVKNKIQGNNSSFLNQEPTLEDESSNQNNLLKTIF